MFYFLVFILLLIIICIHFSNWFTKFLHHFFIKFISNSLTNGTICFRVKCGYSMKFSGISEFVSIFISNSPIRTLNPKNRKRYRKRDMPNISTFIFRPKKYISNYVVYFTRCWVSSHKSDCFMCYYGFVPLNEVVDNFIVSNVLFKLWFLKILRNVLWRIFLKYKWIHHRINQFL